MPVSRYTPFLSTRPHGWADREHRTRPGGASGRDRSAVWPGREARVRRSCGGARRGEVTGGNAPTVAAGGKTLRLEAGRAGAGVAATGTRGKTVGARAEILGASVPAGGALTAIVRTRGETNRTARKRIRTGEKTRFSPISRRSTPLRLLKRDFCPAWHLFPVASPHFAELPRPVSPVPPNLVSGPCHALG